MSRRQQYILEQLTQQMPELVSQAVDAVVGPGDGSVPLLRDLAASVSTLAGQVSGKASQNSVTALAQRVGSAETTLTSKADAAYVDKQLQAVAGIDSTQAAAIAAVQQALAVDEGVTQGILAKQTAVDATLGTLRTDVDSKAPAATVSALAGQVTTVRNLVNDSTTGLAATNALAATANTAAAAAATEAGKRLLRTGDTATGSILVPTAQVGPATPRFDQTYGGLNSPVRAAYNFGPTAVTLGPGPLTDPTPQGRRAQVMQVYVTMRTAPTLGASITIKVGTTASGSDVLSKTYLLTALPVLSTLLQMVPTTVAELPAGTVLYAQALNNLGGDGGRWDVIVQSYYKS